jgi:hypothetical protein
MNLRISTLLLLIVLAASCSKDPILIDGNEPPPDKTIEDQTITNYINKVYISLLSREPSADEYDAGFDSMRAADFSEASRQAFLDQIFVDPAYLDNVYANAREELLRGADTMDIYVEWLGLNNLLNDPQLAPFYPIIQMEIGRIEELMDVPEDMADGSLNVRGMYRRVVNNSLYDNFNMGTENFIVSTFQFFMHRSPTRNELVECTKVVDGQEGIMFLQTGESKDDYLAIFFDSDEYYEGQVIYLFNKYLFRNPLSEEMTYYSKIYQQSDDYASLQRLILSLDEFAGV